MELIRLSCGAMVADTPGFSSFDTERMEPVSYTHLDHSLVEDLVQRGELTREQARTCLLYTSP